MAGAPVGNQNGVARRERALTDALSRALLANDGYKLRRFANVALGKALKGDMVAWKEIADRFEGKPKQQMEHTGLNDGPIALEYTQRERVRRIAFLLAANDPEHAAVAAVSTPKRAGGNGSGA